MHLVGGFLLVHTPLLLEMIFDVANSMAAHKVDPESTSINNVYINIVLDK